MFSPFIFHNDHPRTPIYSHISTYLCLHLHVSFYVHGNNIYIFKLETQGSFIQSSKGINIWKYYWSSKDSWSHTNWRRQPPCTECRWCHSNSSWTPFKGTLKCMCLFSFIFSSHVIPTLSVSCFVAMCKAVSSPSKFCTDDTSVGAQVHPEKSASFNHLLAFHNSSNKSEPLDPPSVWFYINCRISFEYIHTYTLSYNIISPPLECIQIAI